MTLQKTTISILTKCRNDLLELELQDFQHEALKEQIWVSRTHVDIAINLLKQAPRENDGPFEAFVLAVAAANEVVHVDDESSDDD